jgi:hypothetical protein
MDVGEGAAIAAMAVAGLWAAYQTGWKMREERGRELEAADERGWFELSLILQHDDEAELAKLDREFGCDALGRLRRMKPETLVNLRAGEGRLFDELSDRLLLQERKRARLHRQVAADPGLEPAHKALLLGSPSA